MAKIFKNLDTLDLVRCSRVNKLWFREARKLLKSQRVYARPRYSYPCGDLKRFDRFLKKIQPHDILYNGLYLQFDNWHWKCSPEAGCEKYYDNKQGCEVAKNISYRNVLNKLPLKYLKINWCDPGRLEECPAALVVPEILVSHGETLKEIEIEEGPYVDGWLFDDDDLRSRELWMPKLKSLKGKPLEYPAFEADAVLPLIRNAPNLEDLLVCVSSKEMRAGLVPKSRYKIIKSLSFEWLSARDLAAYADFACTGPELRFLILQDYNYDRGRILFPDDSNDDDSDGDADEEEQLGWQIFQRLLQSSRESLEMIRIPMRDLANEVNLDWHVFPNVTLLALEIPLEAITTESYIHELLFKYDFKTRFPNLATVKFVNPRPRGSLFSTLYEDVKVTQESQLSLVPADPCTIVRKLTLNHHATIFSLEYCAALFPHLTDLDVCSDKDRVQVPYGKIWGAFPNLEALYAREPLWWQADARTVNYDADFLGIFEDEAKELRSMDLKAVTNMHIVPIKPSILAMKSKNRCVSTAPSKVFK